MNVRTTPTRHTLIHLANKIVKAKRSRVVQRCDLANGGRGVPGTSQHLCEQRVVVRAWLGRDVGPRQSKAWEVA
jgi:hypothetical protein